MTDTLQNPEELLPLTPAVFNILLALADGEKHGYGIMLEVEANTKGQVLMGPGTLYGSRVNQLDFRVSKSVRVGQMVFRGIVDAFNVLNRRNVTSVNNIIGLNPAATLPVDTHAGAQSAESPDMPRPLPRGVGGRGDCPPS